MRCEVGNGAGIQRRERRLVAEEMQVGPEKRTRYIRPDRPQQVFMHKERLGCIVRGMIVDLRSRAVSHSTKLPSINAGTHLGVRAPRAAPSRHLPLR